MVLFAGMWSQRPPAGVSVIAAINSAIEGLARALAMELAPLRHRRHAKEVPDKTDFFDAHRH